MSVPGGRTSDMRKLPPELPQQDTQLWSRPAVLPLLPLGPRNPDRTRPLPDAVAVRRIPVPAWAPPFDDRASQGPRPAVGPARASPAFSGQSATGQSAPGQSATGQSATGQNAAAGQNATAGRSAAGPTRPARPDQPPERDHGPDRKQRPDQPPAEAGWPSQFAQILAEALAGSRPAQHVRPWTTEQARQRIRQLGPVLQASQQPRVRRVLTSAPSRGVVEMTVIVGLGPRTRALAVRLEQAGPDRAGGERDNRRWLCTAIEAA